MLVENLRATFQQILKPDVMAPGTQVLTAWPAQNPIPFGRSRLFSGFRMLFGTSISTPHAAGVPALLKGAHPKWSPAAIRSVIMTTADVLDNIFKPINQSGSENLEVASPLAMEAGHINPNRALDPGLIYDATPKDYLKFLCSMFTTKEVSVITRLDRISCSKSSPDLNYPSFIDFYCDTKT